MESENDEMQVKINSFEVEKYIDVHTGRIEVYEKLGINRHQGSKLCGLLGYKSSSPLTKEEIDSLYRLTLIFKSYQKRRIGLKRFCEIYSAKKNTQ